MSQSPSLWYYKENNQLIGPLSNAELARAVRAGSISGETLIAKNNPANLVPAQQVKGLFAAAQKLKQTKPRSTNSEKKRPSPSADNSADNSANTANLPSKPKSEATPNPFAVPKAQRHSVGHNGSNIDKGTYAGFWVRFGAYMLDSVFRVIAINAYFTLPALLGLGIRLPDALNSEFNYDFIANFRGIIGYALFFLYSIILESIFGATFGKMIFGLKVVMSNGEKARLGRIITRNFLFAAIMVSFYFLMSLSLRKSGFNRALDDVSFLGIPVLVTLLACLPIFITGILIATDRCKQGWYDKVFNTIVIHKKRAANAQPTTRRRARASRHAP